MALNIVIMAGGSGTRLWPMSRKDLPKQLQKLVGEKTLIQQTVDRVRALVPAENILVGTVNQYKDAIHGQVEDLPLENIIVEPELKNNAGAIGLNAIHLYHRDPQAVMVSLHSDHAVSNVENFHKAILTAQKVVETHPEYLVTVGVKPTRPSTELGYIKMDTLLKEIDGEQVFKVEQFVEKPNEARAEEFFASSKYLWNAGYFVWRVDVLLDLYKQFLPNTYERLMTIEKAIGTPEYEQVLAEQYSGVDEIAIDPAILEKAPHLAVIPADLGWSDIGTWAALHEIMEEMSGHHVVAKGEHIGIDNENSLIYSHDKLIATVGLKNIIIIDTPDVLFVADKSKATDVKKLLEKLKAEGKHHYL